MYKYLLAAALALVSLPVLAEQGGGGIDARLQQMNAQRDACFKQAAAVAPKAMKAAYEKCNVADKQAQQQFKADMKNGQAQARQARPAATPRPAK